MNPENIQTSQDMMNLCIHENMRVYHDKLSCLENKKMIKQGVQNIMKRMMTSC